MSVFWQGKIDGKEVVWRLPALTEEQLNKPLVEEKSIEISEDQLEEVRKHEQLYRAIQESLVEEGIDATFYGTGGVEKEHCKPVVVVMVYCEKYSVMISNMDICVVKQPDVAQWIGSPAILFATALAEPDSLERLAEFFKTLP